MTARLRQILILLLTTEQFVSVQALAKQLEVSKRTIQRELKYISPVFADYQLTFCTKTGAGVWLEGSRDEKDRLLSELKQEPGYDAANIQDRRKRLILEILKEKGLRKLFHYSSLLGVSEATVSSDLEAIEGWLKENHLFIIRKPGSGIEIEGTEESYRKAIRLFIEENMDTKLIKTIYGSEDPDCEHHYFLQYSNLGKIMNDEILRKVSASMLKMNDKRILSLTEDSYIGLVLHIAIAVNRIQQKAVLAERQAWDIEMEQDEEYRLAQQIIETMEKEFSIAIPEIEISYIYLHLKGSKHQKIEWQQAQGMKLETREMLALVNELVNAYDPELAFALKQDDEFIQALLAHLQPTFVRLIHQMKINNPVLNEIKSEYQEIFEKCRCAARVLEKWTEQRIPEDEIGYLAIHFGAAEFRLEGKKENLRPVSVGIVCASGIGISRLLASKLEKTFKNRIRLQTYGKNDLTSSVKARTDFFVDTILVDEADAHMIQVSPLLSKEDMESISEALYYYERTPERELKEAKFTLQLDQVNYLTGVIKDIFQRMEDFEVEQDITFMELVRAGAERLASDAADQTRIAADIHKRERLGTQIFAEFGFALLHVRTTGVKRPSFSVCRTKEKKCFTDPYFKEIRLVLIMLIPEDENQNINSQMFGYLSSNLIEEEIFLETLFNGGKKKIQELLSEYLEKFFYEYLGKQM